MAFLLHLYQPPTQTEAAFKVIAHDCYVPLIKLIKSKSNCKFTLNTPLSLLEQLEKYGYSNVINQIKELVEADRVELVGSAAYHPLLTKIPEDFVYKQIVLNEYGLGYYFGQRQGFEGEISMMVKDIRGFFPPELAINKKVLEVLDDLNYEWVVVDEYSTPAVSGLFTIDGIKTYILYRDSKLSNLISFKRDDNVEDIGSYILQLRESNKETVTVVLDEEVFGHHSKEGLYLLEAIIDSVASLGVNLVTVSEALDGHESILLPNIVDSTWSGSKGAYLLWADPKNVIHKELWDLSNLVVKEFATKIAPKSEEGFENIPTWKEKELDKISDVKLKEFVALELLILKSMHNDQFKCASNATVCDKTLYSPTMVKSALDTYKKIAEFDLMRDVAEQIHQLSDEIERQLV